MKKNLALIAILVMLSGISNSLFAQTAATAVDVPAGAVLIEALTITNTNSTSGLNFGSIRVTGPLAGTVTLASTLAAREVTGDLELSDAAPEASNAAFDVTGTLNEAYSLQLPASFTITSGGSSMIVDQLKARFSGAAADATTSTLNASGLDSFTLGGTLNVEAGQAKGVYAGTFDVTIDYD